jgi:hypothetical protein
MAPRVRAFALVAASLRVVAARPRGFLAVQAPAAVALALVEFVLASADVGRIARWATWSEVLVTSLVLFPIAVLVNGLGLAVARAAAQGRDASWTSAWRAVAPRYANLAATSALALPAILLGAAYLWTLDPASSRVPLRGLWQFLAGLGSLVSFLLLSGRWELSHAISLFEERSPAQNFGESSRLTRGSRWRVFAGVLAASFLLAVPIFLVDLPFGRVRAPIPLTATTLLRELLHLPFDALIAMALAAFQVIAYERLTAADEQASAAAAIETLDARIARRTAAFRTRRAKFR